MILRSLRLVHVRGLPDVRVTGLPESGLVRVTLPAGAPPDTLVGALQFLLVAEAPDLVAGPAGGDDPGFSFVEAEFRTQSGATFSLFRGVDRRGTTQVSLRESTAGRVTGGDAAVAERLGQLLDGTVQAWCSRHLGALLPAPASAAGSAVPIGGDAARGVDDDVVRAAHRAVQELRRSLRAERLRLLASRRHSELLEHGRRLRHERATVARHVDESSVERDRARTRLQRVSEYRDQLARSLDDAAGEEASARGPLPVVAAPPATAAAASRRVAPGSLIETALIACAAAMFVVLVFYSSSSRGDRADGMVLIALGAGCVVAVASYVYVVARRPVPAGAGAPPAVVVPDTATRVRAWRDSLRRRFADIGDPDDPGLAQELRARLADIDGRLAPQRARLEQLDDAIAVFDVEVGRAARSLHETLPALGAGDTGLPEGTDVRDAVAIVHELGDAVYAAVVERDALLAEGTATPDEARQALAVALDALAACTGAAGVVATCLRRVNSFACVVGEASEEDQLADLLDAEIRALVAAGPRGAVTADRGAADLHGLIVPAAGPEELATGDVAARFGAAAQVVVAAPGAAPGSGERARPPGASRRRL